MSTPCPAPSPCASVRAHPLSGADVGGDSCDPGAVPAAKRHDVRRLAHVLDRIEDAQGSQSGVAQEGVLLRLEQYDQAAVLQDGDRPVVKGIQSDNEHGNGPAYRGNCGFGT